MGDPMVSSQSQTLSTTNSFFTPLIISMLGIGVTALAIMLYHLLLVRYCIRRHAARMAALRTLAGEETLAGVDDKTLQTIPIITYNKPLLTDDQTECAVCLGDVENGDRVRLLPNCNHLFHVKCIDEWFVGHASCPVCRVPVFAPVCISVGPTGHDDVALMGCDDRSVNDGPRMLMLRHCHSLVLPRENKGRFNGIELKRSLSMGQNDCVIVDINIDNDCRCYRSVKDESVTQFQSVSLKVKQSISQVCVGQGQGMSGVLP
ncbi:hypothetical protein R6Q57_003945 [Mikania cordata]